MAYRPEIDSLRAIAVIPVVLFHLRSSWVESGYLGVDVFFVLSGFLISKILLRDMDRGTFRMRHFYARRIRRLGPVILAVLIWTLLVANAFATDGQRIYIAQQSLAALGSVSNFFFLVGTGDYWGPTAETTALLHTWSLSVEEQFYLVFPLLLFAVHRRWPKRVGWVLGAIVIASAVSYSVVNAVRPDVAFYMLPTRAWELACGGLLAAWQQAASESRTKSSTPLVHVPSMWTSVMCLAGLATIFVGYFIASNSRSNEINVALVVLGTMLYLYAPQDAACFRWLSWSPLAYLGRISYSWYMWHWPIIVLNDLTGVYAPVLWVGLAGLAAAILSYHLIEQPTRRREGMVPWILAGGLLVATLAALSLIPRPIQPVDPALFQRTTWYGSYYNCYRVGETSDWYDRIVSDVEVPSVEIEGNEFETEGLRFGGEGTPDVVLLGDSHATMWAHLIHQLAEQRDLPLSVWAINGVDPLFDESAFINSLQSADPDSPKARYDQARRRRLLEWKPKLVIVAMRWSMRDQSRTKSFVEFLASCSQNVLLIGATPELRIGDENARRYLIEQGIAPVEGQSTYLPRVRSTAFEQSAEFVKQLARSLENVHHLPVGTRYAKGRSALVLSGNRCVYLDDDHLTDFGASLAEPEISAALERFFSD